MKPKTSPCHLAAPDKHATAYVFVVQGHRSGAALPPACLLFVHFEFVVLRIPDSEQHLLRRAVVVPVNLLHVFLIAKLV